MLSATVYIVDDDVRVCELVQEILLAAGYRSIAYQSAESFLENFHDDPDIHRCLIADLRMPGMCGLTLQEHLREQQVRMPIIFLTGFAEVEHAVRAMQLGAIDFIEKPFKSEQLLGGVRKAIAHDALACSRVARRKCVQTRLDKLTRREREVLDFLVAGHDTKEIATRLNINPKTVFVHRARIMDKMAVENLVELSRLISNTESQREPHDRLA
ncbi:MAG TPA: response regulator [Pirellulaceae bacterium]|nr:response regulator [Pirellulaceae bacterium]